MKVSTNLAHTRKPQKPMSAAAKFLRDLGYTDEQIIAQLVPAQAAQDSESTTPDQEATHVP